MDYVIHEATNDDASTIGKLVYSLMVEVEHQSPNMNETFYAMKFVKLLRSSNPNYVFIASDGHGKAVGFITIGISSAIYAEGTFGIINELYVVPELRSAGIGKLLLDAAKQLTASKGWMRLEVTATHEQINPRAIRFYQREEFVESGPRLKFELRQKKKLAPKPKSSIVHP
jgi:GNAT superfamily N-acetyltransferase